MDYIGDVIHRSGDLCSVSRELMYRSVIPKRGLGTRPIDEV